MPTNMELLGMTGAFLLGAAVFVILRKSRNNERIKEVIRLEEERLRRFKDKEQSYKNIAKSIRNHDNAERIERYKYASVDIPVEMMLEAIVKERIDSW